MAIRLETVYILHIDDQEESIAAQKLLVDLGVTYTPLIYPNSGLQQMTRNEVCPTLETRRPLAWYERYNEIYGYFRSQEAFKESTVFKIKRSDSGRGM